MAWIQKKGERKSVNTNGSSVSKVDDWRFGKVSNYGCNGPCSNPTWGKINANGVLSLLYGYYFCEIVFWRRCIDSACQYSMSTNNRLRIRERVEWIVCHSDHVSSSETTTCNHQFSEYERWGFFTKRIWMYLFGKFPNIWNCVCRQYCTYHQCCAALSCIATPVSYCNYRIAFLKYCRLNSKTILV